jgi:3'(2'), 5'-bisphosphate nucleotidase
MRNNYTLAVHTAVKAGRAIMEVYRSPGIRVESKADDSPLTLADRKAHRIITAALKRTGLPVLSEEGKQIAFMNRSWWSSFWLVDPLDGTREFIDRNGEFTVNIALVVEGKAEFGVVYAPALGHLYVGHTGRGAFRCIQEKNFRQPFDYLIQMATRLPCAEPAGDHYRVVASRSHFNEQTREYIRGLDTGGREVTLVNAGSSLKLCMVASGEADIYPRLGPTMEWDTAAAHAVVKAAGKNVYRADNNQELEYNKENLLNPYFVVR